MEVFNIVIDNVVTRKLLMVGFPVQEKKTKRWHVRYKLVLVGSILN